MKQLLTLVPLLGAAVLFSGCSPISSRGGVALPPGMIYEDYTVPLTVNVDKDEPWKTLTDPNLPMAKASTRNVQLNLPFIAPGPSDDAASVGWGDMSLEKILAGGELERIAWADARKISVLGVYNVLTIEAYGPAKGSEQRGGPPEGVQRPE